METILEARDLVKTYPGVRAVDGVSLSVTEGICFGMLGPNGAGKTTTVEILEGITPADSGTIRYRGESAGTRFRDEVGIQFQSTALQEFLTVREVLELFASLYPAPRPVGEVASLCALEAFMDRDSEKLSGGQRQRLLLGIALINDPSILFLDEPTTGLDPQARRNFWDLVRRVKAEGKTVVLTTHYMEEAYELCDEIVIMDRGRVIAHGSPDRLLKDHFEGVTIELPLKDFHAAKPSLPEGSTAAENGQRVEIHTSHVEAVLKSLLDAGVPVGGMRMRAQTLEDLFLELTGRELRA